MDLSKKVKILENVLDGKSEFEILEFEKFEGVFSLLMVMGLYFVREVGLKVR